MVNCPLCSAVIDVEEEELDVGDSLICEECGANLEVKGTEPLEIAPEDDDEDDEDEDGDFDDEDEDLDEDDDDESDEDDRSWS